MAGTVSVEFTRGELAGKKFTYDYEQRVFIGRQDDCAVVVPEGTVSRYHCVLLINPPEAVLCDFGSLNGTYLNDVMIGRRDKGQSWEDAAKAEHDKHKLNNGDRVGLGKRVEFKVKTHASAQCAMCNKALEDEPVSGGTVLDDGETYFNKSGERICEDCYKKLSAVRLGTVFDPAGDDDPASQSDDNDKSKKCSNCAKSYIPDNDESTLCPDCAQDPDIVCAELLKDMIRGDGKDEGDQTVNIKGYECIKLLGRGGMGSVWKVRSKDDGKVYALKTMLVHPKPTPASRSLFLREAKIAVVLKHKNVIRTYKTGSSNGTFYILMDLYEGGTVEDAIENNGGKLDLVKATYIILQVLDGLDYVHSAKVESEVKKGIGKSNMQTEGVVHRDIKPGNIFLSDKSDRPTAIVADFGFAKAYQAAGFTHITTNGEKRGTPKFIPRQQVLDCRFALPEVDVWAAAATYYCMLTGVEPKDFDCGKCTWDVMVTERAVPIRERAPEVPGELAAVIDYALTEVPEIGYKTAAELKNAIVSALPEKVKSAVSELI